MSVKPWPTPALLDGAMGTELERRGARMDAPLWSAHALIEAPEVVRQVHLDYLRAGAQVITTNTFRTHARNLAAGGRAHEAEALTRRAVTLAREAREQFAAEDPTGASAARIAGSVSPLEDCFRPAESPGSHAGPEHRVMAETLAAAGCDLLLVETMGRIDEAVAAVAAGQGLGLPVWLAVVCRADGRLLAGESLEALVAGLRGLAVQALLINCTELTYLPAAIPALVAAAGASDMLLGTYPHTGRAEPGRFVTHAVPAAAFATEVAALARDAGLHLVGSCCGSTPAWTEALGDALYAGAGERAAARASLAAAVPLRG
ncbi:homocysteine S-methyltransferase family protein [Nannocystis bainbridge]|uniref:Homocysteine S-methyltransferase family protein n=1 Tax=Nannocystis bainbridge TaxID=2995303 RepID=A0ABT5DQP8_9BACT|nr:homocysteine S-methyltransferase family protein [Nannocystis bainbridge]MDC0715924.1 homocysteine S-methyltransferase family protein [Nannocystis bainbridge]